MAEKFTYYPMDVDRFDESESVRSMSLAEVGLYVLCLNRSWKIGSLPDDVEAVAVEIRRKVADIRKLWPAVRGCYVPAPGKPGRLVNPTQEEKRAKVSEKSEKARAAIEARWAKKSGRNTDVSEANQESDTNVHTNVHTTVDTDVIPRAFSSISISSSSGKFVPDCARMQAEYPREIDDEDMRYFLSFILTAGDEAMFFKNLPLHAAGWEARFVPKLENFLRKGTWRVAPKAFKAPAKTGLDDTLAWLASREETGK